MAVASRKVHATSMLPCISLHRVNCGLQPYPYEVHIAYLVLLDHHAVVRRIVQHGTVEL
jgi:hypothetical protein